MTPSFFKVLRVHPFRGQLFTEEQGELGRDKVVVLTHGFWQRSFAGRDDVIGKDVRLGGEPFVVVGVLRLATGSSTLRFNCCVPPLSAREKSDDSRHNNNWQQMGRLKPGATLEQAQAQLDAINAANFERFPKWQDILKNARFGSVALDFQRNLVGETRSTLTMLWGGAIFVLLIGCVNIANLVLVRARPAGSARNRDSSGTRRRVRPPGQAGDHRVVAAGVSRRRDRTRAGMVGPRGRTLPGIRSASERQRHRDRFARGAVHRGSRGTRGAGRWSDPGACGASHEPGAVGSRRRPQRHAGSRSASDATGAGHEWSARLR